MYFAKIKTPSLRTSYCNNKTDKLWRLPWRNIQIEIEILTLDILRPLGYVSSSWRYVYTEYTSFFCVQITLFLIIYGPVDLIVSLKSITKLWFLQYFTYGCPSLNNYFCNGRPISQSVRKLKFATDKVNDSAFTKVTLTDIQF